MKKLTPEETIEALKTRVAALTELVAELDERLTNLEEDQKLPFGSYEIEPTDGFFELVDEPEEDDDDFGKN